MFDIFAPVPRRGAGWAGLVLACLIWIPAQAQDPAKAEVHIDNFAFSPDVLTIAPGTTVTWTNRDDIPHTVAEQKLKFRSKALDTDDSYSHIFDTPGETNYFCSLHPHMTGKIVVKAP